MSNLYPDLCEFCENEVNKDEFSEIEEDELYCNDCLEEIFSHRDGNHVDDFSDLCPMCAIY